jgi:K+-sensing histidine kinase KdpD
MSKKIENVSDEAEGQQQSVEHFLELIKRSRRGKFKIYIGMSAGVGKSYRMLQEAQALMRSGIDIKIGYIEAQGDRGVAGRVAHYSATQIILQGQGAG